MDCNCVKFSRHALERMFERAIPKSDVLHVFQHGSNCGRVQRRHTLSQPASARVVRRVSVARGRGVRSGSGLCVVITAYLPDAAQWDDDFTTRRPT